MKKILIIISLSILSVLMTQCTSSSSNESSNPDTNTLFINDAAFPIGTNAVGSFFNSTIFTASGTDPGSFNVRTFTILNPSTITGNNTESITLALSYPSNGSINGTYNLNVTDFSTVTRYGICRFNAPNHVFGGAPQYVSGTVTITDNSNNNYKIVFTTVVLKDNATITSTKTITGFCSTTFISLL